jgi:hypothetical protein
MSSAPAPGKPYAAPCTANWTEDSHAKPQRTGRVRRATPDRAAWGKAE